jgi:hypothetical protein
LLVAYVGSLTPERNGTHKLAFMLRRTACRSQSVSEAEIRHLLFTRPWGSARLGVTNVTILDPKCDILFSHQCEPNQKAAETRRAVHRPPLAWPLTAQPQRPAMPDAGGRYSPSGFVGSLAANPCIKGGCSHVDLPVQHNASTRCGMRRWRCHVWRYCHGTDG